MKVIRRTDQLVNSLMPAILCGELVEGDALPSDQQLGARFNVSRTVVREAFRILGAKGMIEAKPRSGTRVAPRSGWALWDPDVLDCLAQTSHAGKFDPHIADMRAAIEPALAALAASRANPNDLAALQSRLRELQQTPELNAEIAYLAGIFEISGNPFGSNALNLSVWACKRYRDVPVDAYSQLTVSICQGQPEAARRFALQAILDRVRIMQA
jgi:DNA-binding FadR family transcriptional regulator